MDDLISFACPACGVQMRAPWSAAGRPGRCTKCQKEFIVPAQLAMDDPAPARAPSTAPTPAINPFQRTPPPPKPVPGVAARLLPMLPALIGAVVLAVGGWFAWSYFSGGKAEPTTGAATAEGAAAAPASKDAEPAKAAPTPAATAATPVLSAEAQKAEADREMDRQRALVLSTKHADAPAAAPVVAAVPAASVATPAPASAAPAGPHSPAELLTLAGPSVVMVSSDHGSGAGVILFEPSLIVTTYHVVHAATQLSVDYFHGAEHSHQNVTVVAVDRDNDLALLSSANPYHAKPLPLGDGSGGAKDAAVFAIINPPLGAAASPQSTVAGTISAAIAGIDHEPDARLVLQTSALVPAASSGCPLLAADGTVVGLVTGKADGADSSGLTTPGLLLERFYQGRADKFAIGGDFKKWESDLPFTDLKKARGAVPINGIASHLLYDAERDQLVMLVPTRNKVLFINVKDGTTKELFAGTDPVDLKPSLTAKNLIWVANNSSKSIVSVNLTTRVVEKTLSLTNAPLAMTLCRDAIWFMNGTGTPCVVKYSGGVDEEAPLSVRSLAYNGTRNNILMGSKSSWLCEVDGDNIQKLIHRRIALHEAIDDYNKNAKFASQNSADARYQELTEEMRKLELAIGKSYKVYNQPAGTDTDFTSTQQSLFLDQARGRVYFNRAVMDSKAPDKIIGVFKSPEHSLRYHPKLQELFTKYNYLTQIIAISPDGGVAASGTHLYNTADFTMLRELPVPTTAVAFAPDMKTLYFCDIVNEQIVSLRYRDDSWTPPGGTGDGKKKP